MGCIGLTVRVHDGNEPQRNYGQSGGAYHGPPPQGPPPHGYPPHGPHHYGPPPHGPGRF